MLPCMVNEDNDHKGDDLDVAHSCRALNINLDEYVNLSTCGCVCGCACVYVHVCGIITMVTGIIIDH